MKCAALDGKHLLLALLNPTYSLGYILASCCPRVNSPDLDIWCGWRGVRKRYAFSFRKNVGMIVE